MSPLSKNLRWTTALAVVLAFGSSLMASTDNRHRDAVAQVPIAYTQYYCYDIDCWDVGAGVTTPGVATAGPEDSSPTWSPDAAQVAFVRSGDVVVMAAATGTVVNITNTASAEWGPAWSPNGQRIAFVSDRDGQVELYLMASDGSDVVRVTTNHGTAIGRPTWSPDSARVAFPCQVDVGNPDICAINANGTGFLRLTDDPLPDIDPAWSPDGSTIAFATTRNSTGPFLASMSPDGTGEALIGGIIGWNPAWSPDGRQIAFTGNTESNYIWFPSVYTVRADGTNLRLLAIAAAEPAWMPTSLFASFHVACNGLTCTLDATGSIGNISDYGWGFGDQTSGAGDVVSHTYAAGGQYTVDLTVTDAGGATATDQQVISVSYPPVASFTATCNVGLTCLFDWSSSYDPDGLLTGHAWTYGGPVTLLEPVSQRAVRVTYAAPGTYTAELQVRDDAGTWATARQTFTVISPNQPPVASFTATCNGSLTCLLDPSASYDPDGSINRVEWTFGDGTASDCAGGSSCVSAVLHTYPAGGTYTATVRVTDVAGATATASQTFTVVPSLHVGDIDRATTNQKGKWSATITISVHDSSHQPLANALVTASWSTGGAVSCTTNAAGSCAFTKSNLTPQTKLTLTVTDVQRGPFVYQPQGNHDPDGDSNGTTITISR